MKKYDLFKKIGHPLSIKKIKKHNVDKSLTNSNLKHFKFLLDTGKISQIEFNKLIIPNNVGIN